MNFSNCEYCQEFIVEVPAHNHPIQITIFLSGSLYSDIHPSLGGTRSYFSGSGISPAYVEKYRTGERLTYVNLEIDPEWLTFLLEDQQYASDIHKLLFKGEDWKASFYPTATPTMRAIAQQLCNAPYRGTAKRLYLQAKVFELLAMHLDLISASPQPHAPRMKPQTIARLHYAKEILTTQFEQPPSLPELAQQVGVSHRTLQRGFQVLFQTTVVGYLTQQRLDQAEQLLRQGGCTVAEVANSVGYAHLGHFAVAFKQRFGITPSQCLAGKRVIRG